jgi:carboxymethylenebutenolidase
MAQPCTHGGCAMPADGFTLAVGDQGSPAGSRSGAMCDDEIHQGLMQEPALSRRAFGLAVAASAVAGATGAAAAGVVERDVEVKTADGTCDCALAYPQGQGPWPAVIIWTDVMGLRPVFRDMTRRLAGEGYVVLTPNVYYRARRSPVIEGSFDFNKPEDRARLTPLRASVTADGTARDAVALMAFLDAQPQVDRAAKAGVQGYCMGGPLTLQTAAAVPGRIGAGASFHGGGLVTAEPSSPHRLIPRLRGAYVIDIAHNDDQRQPEAKDVLKAAFAAAALPATVEVYPADHGWCVRDGAAYDEAAAEKAWAGLLALYKSQLRRA